MTGIGLALLAGLLSTLSPCVLPLVPIVIGTALGKHRYGPVALAAGLAVSFVVIGLFIATVGFAAGLDQELFRSIAAMLLILVGVVLLMPRLQLQLAAAAGPMGNRRTRSPAVFQRMDWVVNLRSGLCSARCGAHASGQPSAPPRFSPRAPRI